MTMPAKALITSAILLLTALTPLTLTSASAADAVASTRTSATAPTTGYSGLPVPRFVNLKSEETNGRVGPSLDYPIRFVFNRRGLPVRVIAETPDNAWRKVEDHEGETMWIHHSQLISSDVVLVTGETVYLHAQPARSSEIRAGLQRGVLARMKKCEDSWCLVTADGYRGWVPKTLLWGID